jgi:ubiquinone/menaquinone biosynthesis C-methylase UbiE
MTAKAAKGYKGMGMEGPIANWYAQITRKKMDEYKNGAKKVAESVAPGAAVLEVAPGPGYLAVELARMGSYRVTGLDISNTLVEIARKNAKEAGVQVDFRQGDAAHMPFAGDSFDFITCHAAFKNFAEPVAALDEMYRVLKPGGKATILDLRGDVSPEAMNRHVKEDLHLTGINALMTRWAFRFMLIKRAYTKDQFTDMVAQSRFKTCRIQEDAIGLEIMLEK